MMGFHEIDYPDDINFGSEGGPSFSTAIIEVNSGAEERIGRWSGARRKYNAAWNIRRKEQLMELIAFYIRRQGPLFGFRFKDFLDFTSNDDGATDPDDEDVQIGVGDNSETEFQLIKKYTDGVVTRTRNIEKPVSGTVVVALDGVAQGSGWSVDITTGLITFSVAPGNTVLVTAGYKFDVPVRFGREVDTGLLSSLDDTDMGSIGEIPLIELRNEGATADEYYFGGSAEASITANIQITELTGRVLSYSADQNGRIVKLQDPTNLPMGGPYHYIRNASGSFNLLIHDEGDVLIGTLAVGETAIILLAEISSAKQWVALVV